MTSFSSDISVYFPWLSSRICFMSSILGGEAETWMSRAEEQREGSDALALQLLDAVLAKFGLVILDLGFELCEELVVV